MCISQLTVKVFLTNNNRLFNSKVNVVKRTRLTFKDTNVKLLRTLNFKRRDFSFFSFLSSFFRVSSELLSSLFQLRIKQRGVELNFTPPASCFYNFSSATKKKQTKTSVASLFFCSSTWSFVWRRLMTSHASITRRFIFKQNI